MANNWRILVVEDDPDGQVVVATMLERLNVPIDVASNGAEAEHLLFETGNKYSAIILDLALPDKDGWEILSQILANPHTQDIPCVAVTAFHNYQLREQALEAGFTAYFPKPIDSTAFARRLEEIV